VQQSRHQLILNFQSTYTRFRFQVVAIKVLIIGGYKGFLSLTSRAIGSYPCFVQKATKHLNLNRLEAEAASTP
jgi:hypothetical protein